MFKFLRVYKAWILAVFGSLLLVVFLVPQAIEGLSRSAAVRGGAWARVGEGNERVSYGDLDRLQRELRILQAVGNPTLAALGADRRPEHWFLLRREAERAGLHGGPGDGRLMLDSMTASVNAERARTDPTLVPLTEMDVLGLLCQSSGASPPEALETLARLGGVVRLVNLFAALDRYSDRRLEKEAAAMLLGVAADLVVIDPAKAVGAPPPDPTDAELLEHLAAFAVDAPGDGRHGFGYRTPDRFKIEWMTIPKEAVRQSVARGTDLDALSLRRRFNERPEAFGAPTGVAERPRFEDYAAQVRAVVLEEISAKRFDELSKLLGDRFAAAQRAVPRGSSGRYLVDEAWLARMPSFNEVAGELATEFNLPSPTIGSSGETWFTLADLETIPGVASATTTRFGTTPLRVRDLVAAAREFGGTEAISLQVGIASPVFTTPSSELVVIRLLAAEPSAPAQDLAGQRDRVLDDLRRLLAFQRLEADLPRIEAQAVAEGLRSVARAFDTTVEHVPTIREADPQFLQSGFRIASSLPGGIGRDEELVRAIVTRAMALPLDAIVSELPAAERTFAIADDTRLIVLVVRITDLLPLTREVYEPLSSEPRFRQALIRSEFADELFDIFSYEAMSERNLFRRIRQGTEDETLLEGEDEFGEI